MIEFKMRKHKNLLILGAGGHGRVVADVAKSSRQWKQIAFLDDEVVPNTFPGIKIIGKLNTVIPYLKKYDIFVAIGNNRIREQILTDLENKGAKMPVIIHPNATIGSNVKIGAGTVIMPGVIINCNSSIGKGCIINTGSSIDHDNIIGDYVHLSPGVHTAGTVKIGKGTWIGIGAVIRNDMRIGSDCMIGAGAVVVKDILEAGIYVGNPAKRR